MQLFIKRGFESLVFIFILVVIIGCGKSSEKEVVQKDQTQNAKTFHLQGKAYFESHEYPKAVEEFKKALDIDPSITEVFYDRACANIEMEIWDDAKKDLEFFLKLPVNEKSYKAYERLGYIFHRDFDYTSAINFYDKALEINPAYLPAAANRTKAAKARRIKEMIALN